MKNRIGRLWEFISYPSHSRTLSTLALLIIAASIPLTVFVAQQRQNFSSQAWYSGCTKECGDCPSGTGQYITRNSVLEQPTLDCRNECAEYCPTNCNCDQAPNVCQGKRFSDSCGNFEACTGTATEPNDCSGHENKCTTETFPAPNGCECRGTKDCSSTCTEGIVPGGECIRKDCDTTIGRKVCIEKWRRSDCSEYTKPGGATNEVCGGGGGPTTPPVTSAPTPLPPQPTSPSGGGTTVLGTWYGCSAWTPNCQACGADSNHPNELWCTFTCTACGTLNSGSCGDKCGSSGPPSSACTWGGWQRCGNSPITYCTPDACARCLINQVDTDGHFLDIYRDQGGWNVDDCDTQTEIMHNWCSVANPTRCNTLKNGVCAGQCGIWGCSGNPCTDCILQKGPNLLAFYRSSGWNTDCGSEQQRAANDWCTNLNSRHCEDIKNSECAPSCGRSTTPTTAPGDTLLSFTLTLGGIGSGGNPNPIHTQKQFTVQLFDNSNNQVGSNRTGALNFDSSSGTFRGNISLGGGVVTRDYSIKIKGDKYLRRRIPQIVHITSGTTNQISLAILIVGDANNDNKLDPLDYNLLLSCYGASATTPSCETSDLDDNGSIRLPDFNLLIRNLSVQPGD